MAARGRSSGELIFIDTSLIVAATVEVHPGHGEAGTYLDQAIDDGMEPTEVNPDSVSFVCSTTDARVWVKPLHAIAVRTRPSATGDGFAYPRRRARDGSSGTDGRGKDPLAKSVPGLVQQAQ